MSSALAPLLLSDAKSDRAARSSSFRGSLPAALISLSPIGKDVIADCEAWRRIGQSGKLTKRKLGTRGPMRDKPLMPLWLVDGGLELLPDGITQTKQIYLPLSC